MRNKKDKMSLKREREEERKGGGGVVLVSKRLRGRERGGGSIFGCLTIERV